MVIRDSLRRAGLILPSLAGIVWLSLRVDTAVFLGRTDWVSSLLGHSGEFVSAAVAAVAAYFVLRSRRRPIRAVEAAPPPRRIAWWWPLGAHCALLALLVALTERLFAPSAAYGLLLPCWLLAGLLALGSWLLAAAPLVRVIAVVRTAWPIALVSLAVGVSAWGAGLVTDVLWSSLSRPTFWLVEHLLGMMRQDVLSRPAKMEVGTGAFSVTIAASCSGYQGIGLVWVFLATYLWIDRHNLRFPRVLLLFPLGTAAVWLANALRIAAMIIVGSTLSRDVALGGFHSQVGWLMFIAVALGLVALAQRMTFFGSLPLPMPALAAYPDPTPSFLLPFLVLLGVGMVTSAMSSGMDWLYPVRIVSAAIVLWACWKGQSAWRRLKEGCTPAALAAGFAALGLWIGVILLWGPAKGGAGLSEVNALPAGWRTCWLGFRVLGSITVVPLAEELAFRGYLLRRLIGRRFAEIPYSRFTWLSFIGSSAAFGVLHGQWLAGTLAGACYAWTMRRDGKLSSAIVAHALTNLLVAAAVLITGDSRLW